MDNLKRLLTGIIGFPIVAIILIFSNTYIFDVIIGVIALIMIIEYCKAFHTKNVKPVKWISYIACLFIAIMHIIPREYLSSIIFYAIPIIMVVLYLVSIFTKMKINIVDISVTMFGIIYIVYLFSFVAILRGAENGNLLVWYIFLAAWGTDILAYGIGKTIGKHKFSKISPKKTIEGCVGGILGSIAFVLLYTLFLNKYFDMNLNYYMITIFAIIWSIAGQIGDFAASTIKRYAEIKDYSELLPGHGGMLDRFDSVIFIAPFAYILLNIFVI